MANTKKDPKWVSLRVPHEHAELIAKASGLDGFPLSTWIIEQSALVAANKLGENPLPSLRPSAVARTSDVPVEQIQETIAKVEELLAQLRGKGESSTSGTRPTIKPVGDYALRNLTPAQLNRAVRTGVK